MQSVINSFLDSFKPPPILTVTEWADENRILSTKGSAEPGRWRTDRTPYLKEVMNCLSDKNTIEQVIFMKGAQIGAPLKLDTLVPTTSGMKRIIDIKIGDFVFGSDGKPTEVLGKSQIFKNQRAYKITFDCGKEVVCDYRHLWTLERDNLISTISTENLFLDYKNYKIPEIKTISIKENINSNTLNAWLDFVKKRRSVRRISKIEEVEKTDTICIKVASSDSLFAITDSFILTHNTESGNNWIGYTIDHAPGPMLLVMPTLETVKRVSKQRITPLIEETETLAQKVNTKKTKDSDNTILMKDFPNGVLILAGANSPAGLRSMPAKKLLLDEIDEYPEDVGGQGDPVALAEARAKTFGNKKKIFKISTPTIEGMSRIAEEFKNSDQRYYYIPCPKCGEFQKLVFKQLKWPKGKPEKAYYECLHCSCHIKDHEKSKFLKAGKWIAENPEYENHRRVGFHLSSLYSPTGWESWGAIATRWVNLQEDKDTSKLKTFINTVLGETWKEKSEVPNWHRLYERREAYEMGVVPEKAVFLTMGVDIQKDRIEGVVYAWGRRKENWVIGHYVLPGDTGEDEVWNKLDDLMATSFPREENPKILLPIKMTCVDSGYQTQKVYDWARRHSNTRLSVIKGQGHLTTAIGTPKPVDVTKSGLKVRRGLKVWPLGVSHLKTEIYTWLRQNIPIDSEVYPVGFSHFPQLDDEFFKQLTAEEVVVRVTKGYSKPEWQKTRERNEALDCFCYALGAAIILGIDRFKEKHWKQLGSYVLAPKVKDKAASKPIETKQKETKKVSRRRSSWL